ncbi:hypothetical protein NKH18_01905 [Streptomyces sp. M10(2022)]
MRAARSANRQAPLRHVPGIGVRVGGDRHAHGGGLPGRGWHRTSRGWIIAKGGPAGCIHVRTLNCAGAHRDRHLPPTLEELRREASWIAGREIAMEAPRWLSRFSDFSRLARSFHKGRVFLVGTRRMCISP